MKNYIQIMPLSIFNASSLSTKLTPINSAGFPGPSILVHIINDSTKDIGISDDGLTVKDCLLHGTERDINFSGTATGEEYKAQFRKGTVFYVSGESGATGYIYMSVYYLIN